MNQVPPIADQRPLLNSRSWVPLLNKSQNIVGALVGAPVLISKNRVCLAPMVPTLKRPLLMKFQFITEVPFDQASVVCSVIQTTGTVEFLDDLRTGVLFTDCWWHFDNCNKPRINLNILLG